MKKKLVTITTTALLLLVAVVLNMLQNKNIIKGPVIFMSIMLVATAFYVFGGCMLQTFCHNKLSIALGIFVFFVLCTCLFYSIQVVDYLVFAGCMALLIRRHSNSCDCMPKCDNILR